MKRLIAISVLTMLMVSFGSLAQSNEMEESKLLAKAETHKSSVSKLINTDEKINSNFERNSNNTNIMNNGASKNSIHESSGASELENDSKDISLLIKSELNLEKSLDLVYRSPSLKAEELPLVMSSKDKKTKGVVLPPFLYFKIQF
ncbi:hypothetical protein MYX76_07890 [Desulfobacterota bacterium AH_259_B03_O07]|nr:hypothetical protein [Desulfobacterota bacterium AH_259_B03_O07]